MAENAPNMVQMATRVPRELYSRLVAEQERIKKLIGIEPSLNEVTKMLLEKGLAANDRKR